eukprot:jgi/Psemu1/42298/gm1.42298_g
MMPQDNSVKAEGTLLTIGDWNKSSQIDQMSLCSWLEGSLSETLRLNEEGIECLQRRKFQTAIELFQHALTMQERVGVEIVPKVVAACATADSFRRDISTVTSDLPKKCRTGSTGSSNSSNSSTHSCESADFFVRRQNQHPSEAEEMVFGEPIRLPSTILNVSSMIFVPGFQQKSPSSSVLLPGWVYTTMQVLTFCHAYNLALSHHLRGIEVEVEVSCGEDTQCPLSSSSSSSSSQQQQQQQQQQHLELARHFYKVAIHLKRTTYAHIETSNNNSDNKMYTVTTGFIWIDPRIKLACLNNLADVHYRKRNASDTPDGDGEGDADADECRSCYRKLLSSTRQLWGNVQESMEEGSGEAKGLLLIYLQTFARNARKGCFRLLRHTSTRRSSPVPDQSPTSTDQSVFHLYLDNMKNSSTAGAA